MSRSLSTDEQTTENQRRQLMELAQRRDPSKRVYAVAISLMNSRWGGSSLEIAYTTTDKGVRVYKCDTWDDFIAKIRPHYPGKSVGGYIYRGHGHEDWKLSSHWERRLGTLKIAFGNGEDFNIKESVFGPPEVRDRN